MAIVFDYAVKYNGKYYPPNTPIEKSAEKVVPAVEKSVENVEKSKPKKAKVKKDESR